LRKHWPEKQGFSRLSLSQFQGGLETLFRRSDVLDISAQNGCSEKYDHSDLEAAELLVVVFGPSLELAGVLDLRSEDTEVEDRLA
jgi:hypothetical protein